MVNGNGAEEFIQKDIHEIQKIFNSVKIDGIPVYIRSINRILANEIQKILNENNSNGQSTELVTRTDENIKCTNCFQNCRTRSIMCSYCDRWVHCRCIKMAETDIGAYETNQTLKYKCDNCVYTIAQHTKNKHTEQTKPKQAAKPIEYVTNPKHNDSQPNSTLVIPKCQPASVHSNAKGILTEEYEITICNVCERVTTQDDETACERCSNLCHQSCITDEGEDILCVACKGITDQINLSNQRTDRIPEKSKSDSHKCTQLVTRIDNINEMTLKNLKQKEIQLKKKRK